MLNINVGALVGKLVTEIDKVIIGGASTKRLCIAALLSGNHVLLEGLPDKFASHFVAVCQAAVSGSCSGRSPMSVDFKPMDLIGVNVFNQVTGEFEIELGPLLNKNFVFVEEINRATVKMLCRESDCAIFHGRQRRADPDERSYVLPEDIREVVLPVMRHRVFLKFEATAAGHTSETAVQAILRHVPFSKETSLYI